MDVAWWAREAARLKKAYEQAKTMLAYEKRVRDVREEHARVAEERENWQWIRNE